MEFRGGIKLNIGFIGAGKVGSTLGKYIGDNLANHKIQGQRITIKGYFSRSYSSTIEAAEFTNSNAYNKLETLVDECDMIFLTVPDGKIKAVWQEVAGKNIKGKIICHCSGAMSSKEAFKGIRESGATGYSIHPLFAVSDKRRSYKEMKGVFFAIDAASEDSRVEFIEDMFKLLGNPTKEIAPEKKKLYHCGAAFASNLVCALIEESLEVMGECGFTKEEALKTLSPILKGNMEHIATKGPEASLTGAIERNDIKTVDEHLVSLGEGEHRDVYTLLSKKLIEIARRKNPDKDYTEMAELLQIKKK